MTTLPCYLELFYGIVVYNNGQKNVLNAHRAIFVSIPKVPLIERFIVALTYLLSSCYKRAGNDLNSGSVIAREERSDLQAHS